MNTQAEPAAATADRFLDSCQTNSEGVAQEESVILNHNTDLKLIVIRSLRRAILVTMRDPGVGAMRTG